MTLKERIKALSFLGKRISRLPEDREIWAREAYTVNNWFTSENVELAFKGVMKFLDENVLETWTGNYDLDRITKPKTVGVVMAGNIPMAGFHDLLSVLISGHRFMGKPSSQDPVLLRKIAGLLTEIEPWFKDRILFREKIAEADAYIATGSDNTSRYFRHYFSKKPNIIRKNRTSVAVMNGEESGEEIRELGKDIFHYFGLGCRSISKLYIPAGFSPEKIQAELHEYSGIRDHHKYANNYEYSRAIYLLKKIPVLDTGFMLFREDPSLFSPVSVIHYQYYKSLEELDKELKAVSGQIQVVCSAGGWYENSLPFGKTQFPEVWDYADKVDTLEFLSSL